MIGHGRKEGIAARRMEARTPFRTGVEIGIRPVYPSRPFGVVHE
jgi:hypothetical protein